MINMGEFLPEGVEPGERKLHKEEDSNMLGLAWCFLQTLPFGYLTGWFGAVAGGARSLFKAGTEMTLAGHQSPESPVPFFVQAVGVEEAMVFAVASTLLMLGLLALNRHLHGNRNLRLMFTGFVCGLLIPLLQIAHFMSALTRGISEVF